MGKYLTFLILSYLFWKIVFAILPLGCQKLMIHRALTHSYLDISRENFKKTINLSARQLSNDTTTGSGGGGGWPVQRAGLNTDTPLHMLLIWHPK